MHITFDPLKDASNVLKHGVSLAAAASLDWETALTWLDTRKDYDEPRECALGVIEDRVYYVAYVIRGETRRIISMRKANVREARKYVEET